MSGDGLAGTLDLLRRVLALEQRQGYRNTAAMGGLYRYFQDHFGKHEYDPAPWAAVDGLLRGLKRYEAMGTVAERHAQTEILLRRLVELEGDRPEPAQRDADRRAGAGLDRAAGRGDGAAFARDLPARALRVPQPRAAPWAARGGARDGRAHAAGGERAPDRGRIADRRGQECLREGGEP